MTAFQSSGNSGRKACFFKQHPAFPSLFKQLLYLPEMSKVVFSCKWHIHAFSDSYSNFKSIKSMLTLLTVSLQTTIFLYKLPYQNPLKWLMSTASGISPDTKLLSDLI